MIDFCPQCREETMHAIMEEMVFDKRTSDIMMDETLRCLECNLVKRKNKARKW